jgi:hypothetical protein
LSGPWRNAVTGRYPVRSPEVETAPRVEPPPGYLFV